MATALWLTVTRFTGWPFSRLHEITWLFQYRQGKITRYRLFTDMVNGRCFILMKNRVRPDSQLFNSWGCNGWGRHGVSPSPADLGVWESGVSSPSGVRGGAPAEKWVLEYLELEKTHLISLPLTFSIFPDHFGIPTFPGFPGEWSPWVQQFMKR